ncbi:MAG: DUF2058 family protein [Planctomycetes bacterium]|nr:DUF2058 family protein [Planctomycetota bacterium]
MNLRDQFKKAKLLSDKDARRLAHEARVERTEKGREGLEQEAKQRQQEIEALQAREREKVRREQDQRESERRLRAEVAAARALLAAARKPGPGAVKFYFETGDGALPWLELSPREAQELRAGALCVVRSGPPVTHTYRLLSLDDGRRVARSIPEAIVHAPRGVLPN